MRMRLYKQVLLHVFVVLFMAIVAFPLGILLFNSFKTEEAIILSPIGWPEEPTLANFTEVVVDSTFPVNFRNSTIVAFSTVLFAIFVTAPAGYAMSRFKFRGKRHLSVWLLAAQSFPGIIMVLGLLTLLRAYGLLNTFPGLVITYTSFSMPFSIWLLKGYFDKIPFALEEAALIDGCGKGRALLKVVLPLSVPGLLAVGTFSFLLSWNEFFFAMIIMRDPNLTLPVFLARFLGTGGVVRWGPLSAAALMVTLPVLALFMLGQRFLISGLTGGGVK